MNVPRLRIIAGPNGSGKSTIKSILPPILLSTYINPDEIEEKIRSHGFLDLNEFNISTTEEEVKVFFEKSSLIQKYATLTAVEYFNIVDGKLFIRIQKMNSYFSSVVADFIRTKLIANEKSFTFETVMSHPSKINILNEAKKCGYKVYLYYIATEDPDINISRVKNRVNLKGHDVPENKIRERYTRSLELLISAIKLSNRSYIFDNSADGMDKVWLAEITNGNSIEIKANQVPRWFENYVLNKIN